MAWHLDGRDIRSVRDYAEAVALEARIKPIRGRDIKPLTRNRRKTYMNVRKEDEIVKFRLYSTDVVQFHPDGRIEVTTGMWATTSTRVFISVVLGVQVMAKSGRTYIRCVLGSGYGWLPVSGGKESTILERGGERGPYALTMPDPVYPTRVRIKRKEAKQEYARYAAFKDLLAGVGKAMDGTERDEFRKLLAGDTLCDAALLACARGEHGNESRMQAALQLLYERGNWVGPSYNSGSHALQFSMKQVWPRFQKIIVAATPGLTYEEEITDGSLV